MAANAPEKLQELLGKDKEPRASQLDQLALRGLFLYGVYPLLGGGQHRAPSWEVHPLSRVLVQGRRSRDVWEGCHQIKCPLDHLQGAEFTLHKGQKSLC